MLEKALFKVITEDTAIASKISVGGKFNIYPLFLPNEYDLTNDYAITYSFISQTLLRPILKTTTVQFNCFAKTYENAIALADNVESALNDTRDIMLGGLFPINYIKTQSRQSLYDDNTKLWYVIVDFVIKY